MYDILVIGGGPAGLTAALYARRAGKTVLLIEKNTYGGQIVWSPKVENFPGFSSISGLDLGDRMTAQAMEAGAGLEMDEISSVRREGDLFVSASSYGAEYRGKTLIFATGAAPKKLGLPREDSFIGSGISFCAVCDGEFYRNRVTAVIGGGNTAFQEALYLSDICKTVYLIHRRTEFRADASLTEAVMTRENIILCTPYVPEELLGDVRFSGIRVRNPDTNESKNLSLDGLFVAIGHTPENNLFGTFVPLSKSGYAACSEDCVTPTAGVFVAGDCRAKGVKQLTTAVSDGATAALAACHYLDTLIR